MHINDSNSNDACTFIDTFTALSLTQHVTMSTHVKGNILDLMFTEEISSIKLTSCQAGPFLSDHKLVTAILNIDRQPIEKKTLSVCKLHCITENSFKAAFDKSAIDLTSPVETVLYQLNDELCKALDTIASLEVNSSSCSPKTTLVWWGCQGQAQGGVEQGVDMAQVPCTWHLEAYKVERNVYNRLLIYKKRQLITKQVMDLRGNNKKLYKLMAHLARIRTDNPLPPHNSDESLANHFADYFISQINKIQENFSGNSSLYSRGNRHPNLPKVCFPHCRAGN